MKTYIINPDTFQPVEIEDWKKDADPARAQLVAISRDGIENLLLVSKSYLPDGYTFEKAQEACANFKPQNAPNGLTFRAPTRHECIDLYDARFTARLDEALRLIGGDFAKRGRYHWTCERDTDPNYANLAWFSNGYYGCMSYYGMYLTLLALPVALYF